MQEELNLAKEVNIKDHLLSLEELQQKYQTSLEDGLSSTEADIRLKRDGPNAFSPPKVTPAWVMLVKELVGGFAFLFWVAVVASIIIYFIEWLSQDVSLL